MAPALLLFALLEVDLELRADLPLSLLLLAGSFLAAFALALAGRFLVVDPVLVVSSSSEVDSSSVF